MSVADMMVEGALCSGCGVWMDDILEGVEAPGYPRTCEDCENEGEGE